MHLFLCTCFSFCLSFLTIDCSYFLLECLYCIYDLLFEIFLKNHFDLVSEITFLGDWDAWDMEVKVALIYLSDLETTIGLFWVFVSCEVSLEGVLKDQYLFALSDAYLSMSLHRVNLLYWEGNSVFFKMHFFDLGFDKILCFGWVVLLLPI